MAYAKQTMNKRPSFHPRPFLKIMALGPEILGSWVELMCYSCPIANWHETYMVHVGVLHCFIRYAYVVFPVTN